MNIVLQSQDLSVRYAGNIALSGVSIGVHAAKMVGLVGANGAGKTSLVNALAGWSRGRATVSGAVRLEGNSIEGLAAHERVARGLVLVPEGKNIFVELTVDENLSLVRRPSDAAGRHNFTLSEVFDFFPRLADLMTRIRQLELTMTKTGDEVVVDQSNRLHPGVHHRRPHEFESLALKRR